MSTSCFIWISRPPARQWITTSALHTRWRKVFDDAVLSVGPSIDGGGALLFDRCKDYLSAPGLCWGWRGWRVSEVSKPSTRMRSGSVDMLRAEANNSWKTHGVVADPDSFVVTPSSSSGGRHSSLNTTTRHISPSPQ